MTREPRLRRAPAILWVAGLIAAAPLAAEGVALPDWVPGAVTLPEDHRILRRSEIGSTSRILLVEFPGDPGSLIEDWRSALAAAGYTVDEPSVELESGQIRFSGHGIGAGQIVVLPGTAEAVTIVQIDATLSP